MSNERLRKTPFASHESEARERREFFDRQGLTRIRFILALDRPKLALVSLSNEVDALVATW